MGVSLLDACTFDIRDNLVFERQMSKFKDDDYTGGAGPRQMEAGEKKLKQKIEAAEQIGRDVVHFRLGEGKNQRARKINDRDECNPPTKKQRSDAKMVEKRTNTTRNKSAVMKIRKAKIINSFKREYVISSATGKAQYVVSISNVPTCTCQDFQINGENVICKHIIFVLLNVLKLKDETILSKIWF